MTRYGAIQAVPEGGWAQIDGEWYVRPPGTRRAARIPHHTVTEHGDGTITCEPSIIYSAPGRDDYYHGWLRAGVWSEA